jgi:hypothetical protein
MLSEVSISPSLLFSESYGGDYAHKLGMGALKNALLETALTHNLWNGSFASETYRHPNISSAGKKLLQTMKNRNRLVEVPPAADTEQKPSDPISWTAEAVNSHRGGARVSSILACAAVKRAFAEEETVEDLADMQLTDEWTEKIMRRSWLPPLNAQEYLSLMRPVVSNARLLKLVDAYFNPTSPTFADFVGGLVILLSQRSQRLAKPVVEFHSAHLSEDKRLMPEQEIRDRYAPLSSALADLGLRADVTIWSDLHDRYLLTDLGAYILGNSLTSSNDSDKKNTWARLDQKDSDELNTLYTPDVRPKKVVYRLTIGS